MATIRDVSKAAGVSRATITRVLQSPEKVAEKTRIKVQEAIDALDYRPNMLSQTFRTKSTKTIVVLVPNIANPVFAKIVSGIEAVAQEQGYSLLLGDTHNSPEREAHYVGLVETKLADGVLQLSSYSPEGSILPKAKVKAVGIASIEGTPYPCVSIDNKQGAECIVSHLIENGHKRIAVLAGPLNNGNTKLRLEGYKIALQKAGIAFDPTIVIVGDFRLHSGRVAAAKILALDSDRPTAVFCMNDEMAIGVIDGFSFAGLKIPEDISVTGFDDIDMAAFVSPRLTTIQQPAAEMGRRGAELLIQMIEGLAPKETNVVLPFEMTIRDSVIELPASK